MKNKDKQFHFRGQMEKEEVINFFRRHWLVILPQLIPFSLFTVALVVFAFYIPQFELPSLTEPFFQLLVIIGLLCTIIFVHRFFLKMIEYFMKTVIITNYRVVDVNQTAFLHDDKQSIVMKRMQDIQKQQNGIISSLLNYGNIVIIISFADPKVIRMAPSPDYHFRLLNQIRNLISTGEKVTLSNVKKRMRDPLKENNISRDLASGLREHQNLKVNEVLGEEVEMEENVRI
jgi:hypothetical protein